MSADDYTRPPVMRPVRRMETYKPLSERILDRPLEELAKPLSAKVLPASAMIGIYGSVLSESRVQGNLTRAHNS